MWPFGKRIGENPEVASLYEGACTLARSFHHDYLGVEHLFLAFRQLPEDHEVWRTMSHFEIDLPQFFAELEKQVCAPVDRMVPRTLPRTPRFKRIQKLAQQFAVFGEAPAVTATHLLAAIMFERGSVPARLLSETYRTAHPEFPAARLMANALLHQLLAGTSKSS